MRINKWDWRATVSHIDIFLSFISISDLNKIFFQEMVLPHKIDDKFLFDAKHACLSTCIKFFFMIMFCRMEVLETARRACSIGANILDLCSGIEIIDSVLHTKLCIAAAETLFNCVHLVENCVTLKGTEKTDDTHTVLLQMYQENITKKLEEMKYSSCSQEQWLMVIYILVKLEVLFMVDYL